MRRRTIFVDFALIDFRTQVTGIPRVAYAYLEEGYVLGQKQGFEVIPVYVRDHGLVDARPLLMRSNLRRLRRVPGPSALWQVFRSAVFFLANGLRLVAFGLLSPLFVLLSALTSYSFFDFWRNQLARLFAKSYSRAKQVINNRFVRRIPVAAGDVLFMPAYWHDVPPGFYARLKAQGLRICPMLHDVLPITHAEYYESPWREMFRDYVLHTLTQVADHVHYISDFTRREFEGLAGANGLPKPRGSVLHHGHDFSHMSGSQTIARAIDRVVVDSRPFFLMVGSIEPKKNHLEVLKTFESMWLKGIAARLVIVGRVGWKEGAIRSILKGHPQLHMNLIWLDSVNDAELRLLYQRTNGLIQASVAEGFGLPILEALALRTPVLANDIAVFREIGGSAISYFDMAQPETLAEAVRQRLDSRDRQSDASFKWPTWAARAQELFSHLLEER
jgi:glycosyltransferase involved in cell wall biosynthesis